MMERTYTLWVFYSHVLGGISFTCYQREGPRQFFLELPIVDSRFH